VKTTSQLTKAGTSGSICFFGLFSGWWLGESDGRIGSPLLSHEDWDTRLRRAGFDGCETVSLDNERPYQLNSNIIARPSADFTYRKNVSLLSGAFQTHPLTHQVETLLREKGYQTNHYRWGEERLPPAGHDLISFIDLDQPLLQSPSEDDWHRFLQTAQSSQQAIVLWLTRPAQIEAEDPHSALVLGVARTLRIELGAQLATLELETCNTPEAADAVIQVLRRVRRCKDGPANLDPDMEFAWTKGQVNVARFHQFSVPDALQQSPVAADIKTLAMHKRGQLQTLYWKGETLPDLPSDQVQIQTIAAGLNFSDLFMTNTADGLDNSAGTLGMEGAGYVTKVGTDVEHVMVGDRVLFIGANSNGMATQVQRPALLVLPIPSQLSFEEAASMPVVYTTLLLGLLGKAQLAKGQSVLIHASSGEFGAAAIHIARWVQADIYCTVESDYEANLLEKKLLIPRHRIFNLQNVGFQEDVVAATDGIGIDCVLNTSEELMPGSWECVASNGCLVHIGQGDLNGLAHAAPGKFRHNRTFIGVSLRPYLVSNKIMVSRLMTSMIQLYMDGHIRPVYPTFMFDADQIKTFLQGMQNGTQLEKIIVRFPEEQETLMWTPGISKPCFKGDRAYLLVGGMGGLGQAIATWMVTHGTKHVIFLSRSAGKSDDDRTFIHELEMMGCSAQTWAGDVADADTVKRVIDAAPMPIAGVMHMAMVLRDVGAIEMELEDYQAVIRPKVHGAWNLHNALPNDALDFFVVFSSVIGLFGHYGQANYAASNTFLDAFVQYRRNQGLPASAIDIGAVDDVGYVSSTPAAQKTMLTDYGRLVTEQEFLDVLQLAIARSSTCKDQLIESDELQYPSQITHALECQLPIMHPQNNVIWKRDPRMAIYRNIETVANATDVSPSGIKPFLDALKADPSQLDQAAAATFLAGEIQTCVARLLGRTEADEPLDLALTLSSAGVDSLVGIELRGWLKQNLGVDMSVLELMNGGSIQRLGEMAAKTIKRRLGQ
jgi:NADPH:quinone reductase-like Zn-dependent oxidoreductase/NAD(P)-dependent dehydrogenase (short-subunit alcohol dehydrogenase family)